jgi:hypothetical protein
MLSSSRVSKSNLGKSIVGNLVKHGWLNWSMQTKPWPELVINKFNKYEQSSGTTPHRYANTVFHKYR